MLKDKKAANKMLMRYAGMAMQFAVGIGAGIFFGLKLDNWLKISFPLLVWLLPLLLIIGMIVSVMIDTKKNKK